MAIVTPLGYAGTGSVVPGGGAPPPNLTARYAPETPAVPVNPTPEQLAARTAAVNAPAGAGGTPAPLSPLEQAQNSYYDSLPKGPVDENAIRETVRQQMQGQIDATNALYDNLRTQQSGANDAQYKRVRALNVSAGLTGSDFASANAGNAEEKGNAALAAIEQQRAAAVSTVLGNIDTRAQAEIDKKTADAKTNAKDYVDFLQQRQTGAREDLKTLAQSGVALEAMDPATYDKLLKQTGYDAFTLKTVYNNSKSAATKIDYQYKTVGNKLFGYGVDPTTGKLSTVETDLPGDVPANYKPQVLDNGTIIFYPDQIDPTKPVKDQIITYNSGVIKDTRTASEKDSADTQKRLTPVSPAMDALRDPQSGYVDSAAYSDMYQTYIGQNPGKGKEFLDNFPVSIYIDPSERYKFSASGS